MKKMKIILALLLITLYACGQKKADDTFTKMMYFDKGLTTIEITFPDGSKLSSAVGLTSVTWTTLAGKPLTFPPATHTHAYNDITGKPDEVQLIVALSELGIYLGKTTTEINAIVPLNGFGIAFDKTLSVYKVYQNGWRILPTTN